MKDIHDTLGKLTTFNTHHFREEKFLFPALEKLGVFVIVDEMVFEHKFMKSFLAEIRHET